MASYRGHLSLSAPLGAGYGALALLHPPFDWGVIFLGAGLTTIGGLLPDLDSDSGVPVRELFGLMATIGAVLLFKPLHHEEKFSLEQTLVLMGAAYFLIRYFIADLFRRATVHRGMFHSIPAMLIAGLVVYQIYPTTLLALKLYLAGAVMVGFLSHLVLDEIYSIDFMGAKIRFNKFSGSALKFGSASWPATLATYLVLLALLYLTFLGMPDWGKLLGLWKTSGPTTGF
jgi:hypothetical protein